MTGLQVYLDRVKNSKGKKLEKGKKIEKQIVKMHLTHIKQNTPMASEYNPSVKHYIIVYTANSFLNLVHITKYNVTCLAFPDLPNK